ncbi:MAG: 2-phosphosulfolactate phosphatase [Phycisphaerae bacterium]|nr:2-phosphosulfolactate phosphatase [Phycisphaerae bacterium]
MPRLDVRWRPDGQTAGPNEVAVVVDVLRGSTTIVTALALGATAIRATTGVDEARALAMEHQAVLIGERKNRRIEGFDFGNSPVELRADRLRGRPAVFSSTNFPFALKAAERAVHVLIGALVNLRSVGEAALKAAQDSRADIAILLAGEPSEPHAREDYYFAGRMAGLLADTCSLLAEADRAAQFAARHTPAQAIEASIHAQELISDGFQEDVAFAFHLNRFDGAPMVRDGWIVPVR